MYHTKCPNLFTDAKIYFLSTLILFTKKSQFPDIRYYLLPVYIHPFLKAVLIFWQMMKLTSWQHSSYYIKIFLFPEVGNIYFLSPFILLRSKIHVISLQMIILTSTPIVWLFKIFRRKAPSEDNFLKLSIDGFQNICGFS